MITLSVDEDPKTFEAIVEGMKAFNNNFIDAPPPQKFNVALRDASGRIVGGIGATLGAESLYLEVVWNDESVRRQGYGRKMITMVEEEGRRRGAKDCWLYTMSFQAQPFYEKMGYETRGEIPFPVGGHKRIFMWKPL